MRSIAKWAAGVAAFVIVGATATAAYSAEGRTAASGAPAAGLAAAPASTVVGVQDGWINDCGSVPGHPRFPGPGGTKSVPAVDSPYWAALKMTTVRFSPEWDIAYQGLTGKDATEVRTRQACFGYWLGRLAAHGVTPEIAFKPDYCYKNPKAPANCSNRGKGQVVIPALPVYKAAMAAFVAAYPQVRLIAPWGEPDFQPSKGPIFAIGRPKGPNFGGASCPRHATDANCGPVLAARMWVAVREICRSCTAVIAGDFGSNKGQDSRYLSVYHRYLHDGPRSFRPGIWAIHPYTDVTTWEWEISHNAPRTAASQTLVASFARWLASDGYHAKTRIWLDEVSSFTNPPYGSATYSRDVQAKAGQLLLDRLPQAGGGSEPHVTRIYYMRFEGAPSDALIVNGKRVPLYQVFAHRAHPAAQLAPASSSAKPAHKAKRHPARRHPAARRHLARRHPAPRRHLARRAPSPAPATPRPGTAQPPAAQPTASGAVYQIRNLADNLCLDANSLGPTAGKNGDTVQLWNCYGAANQKWRPVYASGGIAWLQSVQYPGKCLNADNTGGLANGHRVQLWDCYNALNELWNVGVLTASPLNAPLYLGGGSGNALALDADKYHLGNGDKVQVWTFYGASSQNWYLTPA